MSGRIVVTAPGGKATEGGGPRRQGRPPPQSPSGTGVTIDFADGGPPGPVRHAAAGGASGWTRTSARSAPDAGEITAEEFRRVLGKGTIAVKGPAAGPVQDRRKSGNLLADEALWQARINPAAPVNSLRPEDVDRLYRALQARPRIRRPRTAARHTGEVIPFRHAGARCPRDGAEMRHGIVGGRSTWWCSLEQA